MLGTFGRIVFGFLFACLAAALVMVLHVFTPADFMKAGPGTFSANAANAALLTLLAATHTAIFASAFALIAAGVGEYLEIRALPYYLFAGVVITILGFIAQFSSETAGAVTINNNYALKTFLTAGFFSGLVYWLCAGRFAGHSNLEADDAPAASAAKPSKISALKAEALKAGALKAGALKAGASTAGASMKNYKIPKIDIAERAAQAVSKASSLSARLAKTDDAKNQKPAVKVETSKSGSVPSTKTSTSKGEESLEDSAKD